MNTVEDWPLSVDDRTALARLVAHPDKPDPFRIGRDNNHAGTLPGITDAVGSTEAYAITVAPDVLAFDLDDPDGVGTLDRLAEELADDGWPVLRVASGREGHRHLWTVIPDQSARDRIRERAAYFGLDVPRPVMRPPGTPHRAGCTVQVLDDPNLFRAAVTELRTASPRGPARERLDWQDLLRAGKFPRGWTGEGSGSSMVWLVCIGAIRAGHDLDTVRGWLADETNLGGAAYRNRLNRAAKRHGDYWLDHYVWPSATRYAARLVVPADATEARAHLDTIRAAIEAVPWPQISGSTDRAVLNALLDRAHARGSLTPTMSHRELAEAAPCSRRTVSTATKRLEAAGWLLVAEKGRGVAELDPEDNTYRERANATRWRLALPTELGARTFPTGGTPRDGIPLSGASSRGPRSREFLDVFRWRGLGLNAPRVLDALAAGPLTAAELAITLDLNRGNLRARLLPKMATYGLVTADGPRWALAEDLDAALDAAAEALGLKGKTESVEAQHAADRKAYLEYREHTRPLRQAKSRRRAAAARRSAAAARRDRGQGTLWEASEAPRGATGALSQPVGAEPPAIPGKDPEPEILEFSDALLEPACVLPPG